MKLVKLIGILATLALLIVACGDSTTTNQTANTDGAQSSPAASPKATAAATPTPDELAAAKTTFMQVCANCHMENGEGGPVKIEGKRLNVPSLTKGHGLDHSDAELAKQITNGGDGMPAYKDRLNTEQINDLVRFIRRDIQKGAAPKAGGEKK